MMAKSKKNIWPKGSAGACLTQKVPVVNSQFTIGQVYRYLNKNINQLETVNYIYVVNRQNKLIGVFSIKEIFRNKPEQKINALMKKNIAHALPTDPENKVANQAIYHNIKAIPVIDKYDNFLGIIPADRIHVILKYQFIRKLNQLAGITRGIEEYGNVLEMPVSKSFWRRIPWLLVGLFGGIVLAHFLGFFEDTLRENIILAAFIPVITYISNATAIQVQTVFIRDLAIHENLLMKKYFFKQLFISLLIAVCCSVLLLVSALLGWTQSHIIIIISISMFFTIIFAVSLSLLVPYIFKKIKLDPGIASGPFSTILQDISSVIIYFLIATWLL